MKARLFNPGLFLAAACSAALTVTVLHADEGDNEQGGDINGSESLNAEIVMTPTADAPPNSSIKAELEAEDEDGATTAKLKLQQQGLPPGTYSVSVTLKSDGSTVPVGTFTVAATPTPTPTPEPTASVSPTPGEDENDQGDNNDDQGDDENGGDTHSGCEFGDGTSFPFPAGFNPFDIATISVSDANNVILFTADLTTTTGASTMSFTASVKAVPGVSNPGVSGTALLTAAGTRGKSHGSVQLTVSGLPPKMPMVFAVNGAAVKNVTANRGGAVNVTVKSKGNSTVNVFKVTSVGLHDKNGKLIVGASF